MNSYKHSGAAGDLIYSLAIAKFLGKGKFYLHLNQMNWIGQHYYGNLPAPFHRDRLTFDDFSYMKSFIEAQDYITAFSPLDSKTTEITHNLDRFRTLFVGHPGNYVDIYADTFKVDDPLVKASIRNSPWLTVPNPIKIEGRPIVVNRTARWIAPVLPDFWKQQDLEQNAVFVGLPDEYETFKKLVGVDIPFRKTETMLELASVIAGADRFIGNQSQALALAIGLGTKFCCELRRDLPKERNECYFPGHPNGFYF